MEKEKNIDKDKRARDMLMQRRRDGIEFVLAICLIIIMILILILVVYLNFEAFRRGNILAFVLMVFVDMGILYLMSFLPD